jgi:quinol monooxygenase YgiN
MSTLGSRLGCTMLAASALVALLGVSGALSGRAEADKEQKVIVEYVRYTVPSARHAEFLAAYTAAAADLSASPECRTFEIAQGVEEPDNFTVRIEWDSIEAHERGFRKGPHFPAFFAKVKPFFSAIQEMKHYQVAVQGRGPAGK